MAPFAKEHLILVVEDDPDIREVTVQVLEDLNYKVLAAENGQQALTLLQEMPQLPCLILVDLMMPIMNGWQLLEAMAKDERLAPIPAVVMSAVTETYTTQLNVAAYLRKPASYEQLMTVLEQHC